MHNAASRSGDPYNARQHDADLPPRIGKACRTGPGAQSAHRAGVPRASEPRGTAASARRDDVQAIAAVQRAVSRLPKRVSRLTAENLHGVIFAWWFVLALLYQYRPSLVPHPNRVIFRTWSS